MKLKRILCLAVSLAMVLSIVPAFGLTASAMDTPTEFNEETLLSLINASETVFDGSVTSSQTTAYSDTFFGVDAWTGWSQSGATQYGSGNVTANLKTFLDTTDDSKAHNRLQYYGWHQNAVNSGVNVYTSDDVRSSTTGKDYVVIEFLKESSVDASDSTGGKANVFTFYSATSNTGGKEFLKFQYTKDGIYPCSLTTQNGDTYISTPIAAANYTPVRVYIAKNSSGTYDIIWQTKEDGAYTNQYTVTGLPASRFESGVGVLRSWIYSSNYQNACFDDLKIYAGNYSSVTDVTLSYKTAQGTELGSKTVGAQVGGKLKITNDNAPLVIADSNGKYYARDYISGNEVSVTEANQTVEIAYSEAEQATEADETKGATWLAVEFETGDVSSYTDVAMTDAAGNKIAGFCYSWKSGDRLWVADGERGYSDLAAKRVTFSSAGTPQIGTVKYDDYTSVTIRAVINIYDGGYTVTYSTVDDNNIVAEVAYTGTVNGLSFPAAWSYTGGGSGITADTANDVFKNAKVYAVVPKESDESTVKAALNELSVPTVAKSNITLPSSATDSLGTEVSVTWTAEPSGIIDTATGNVVSSPDEVTTVSLTPTGTAGNITAVGAARSVTVFPASRAGTEYNSGSGYYDIGTENIISQSGTAASFEQDGEFSLAGWTNAQGNALKDPYNDKENHWYAVNSNLAYATDNQLSGTYTIPDGDWYLGARWNDGTTALCTIQTFWDVTAGNSYYFSFYVKTGGAASTGAKGIYAYFTTEKNYGTVPTGEQVNQISTTNEWQKYEYIFTAETDGYIAFYGYNLGVANNAGNGNNIFNAFDDFELYTATQQSETIESVTPPADITVINGNEPVLPKTVNGTGTLDSTIPVAVTWDTTAVDFTNDGTASKAVTVHGTIDGYEDGVDVTVNVLPQTFTIADAESVNGQPGNVIYFPVSISDEFSIEFDYTINAIKVASVQMGYNGNLYGNAALGISPDGSKLIATGGDGSGTKEDVELVSPVDAGETYRMFLTMDASDDTYTLTVTKADGTIVTTGEKTFRKAQDAINTMTLLTNGGGATGDIAISNVKVYAPSVADRFKTYTVNVTGSVEKSYTVKATSAENVPAPYYEGNILASADRQSGTTVTFTYEATTTSLGSWAIRNNVTDNTWLTEMKYLGSHNSFANTDTLFENEGGTLYNVFGSTSQSSVARNISRTQTLSAIEQLNAGVRYFDIRLSRQSDGSFVTVHGPAFNYFRGIAETISQWAAENPGEVIFLDFQSMVDALYTSDKVVKGNTSYYGESAGDDNKEAYDALVKLLEETGIMDYVYYTGNNTDWDVKYGSITASGTRTAIVLIGKQRLSNCDSRFIDRSTYTSGDTTYKESNSYDEVVSNIDNTYTSIKDGKNFGYIHAYTTTSLSATTIATGANILGEAAENNPKWCTATNFAAWMGRGKGDVLMLNGITEEIGLQYLAYLDEWNRDGTNSLYGNEHETSDGITSNGVTMSGATSSVPFSTAFNVKTGDVSIGTLTIDGVEYTPVTAYNISLTQFSSTSAALAGEVTLTFPKASTDITTVDVLLSADGTEVLKEAEVGEAISYTTSTLGNYLIATKASPTVNMTVNYAIGEKVVYTVTDDFVIGAEAYNIPASSENGYYVKLGDKAYIVSAEAQSYVVTKEDEGAVKTVYYTLVHDNAVLADALWTNADNDNCFYGSTSKTNHLFIASSGDINGITRAYATDADGETLYNTTETNDLGNMTLLSSRLTMVQYNVPEYTEGKAYILTLPIYSVHNNTWNKNNTAIRFAAYLLDNEYDVPDTESSDKINADDSAFAATGNAIISDWVIKDESTELKFDVTEAVKAASEAGQTTMTFKLLAAYGGIYLNNFEIAGPGGDKEGLASYIDVVDGYTVSVTGASKITKNGSNVTPTVDIESGVSSVVVAGGSYITLTAEDYSSTESAEDDILAFVDQNSKLYTLTDGKVKIEDIGSDLTLRGQKLGVSLVNGAQVRIGAGVTEAEEGGYKIDSSVTSVDPTLAGSGLRFIGIVDRINTLAAIAGAEIGIEITAQDSGTPIKVKAEKYQDINESVFTAALVNLKESNYNRIFTARPYVTVNGVTYYGDTVSRSIYEIAAGILVDSTTVEGNDQFTYDVTDAVNRVLNAYVNQVGIRLNLASGEITARTEGTGAYVGAKEGGPAIFFTVSAVKNNENGTYTVTITPQGSAEIFGYWKDYVRLNNKDLSSYIEEGSSVDETTGVLTFVINPSKTAE